jgi:hypothetical protein
MDPELAERADQALDPERISEVLYQRGCWSCTFDLSFRPSMADSSSLDLKPSSSCSLLDILARSTAWIGCGPFAGCITVKFLVGIWRQHCQVQIQSSWPSGPTHGGW